MTSMFLKLICLPSLVLTIMTISLLYREAAIFSLDRTMQSLSYEPVDYIMYKMYAYCDYLTVGISYNYSSLLAL